MKKYRNEPHMRISQDLRKSNATGFHEGTPKQKNKKDRKEAKQDLKKLIPFTIILK